MEEQNQTDLEVQNAELTNTVKQLQADFENYKKRVTRDTEKLHTMATKGVLFELLHVADSFDRAFDADTEGKEFEEGISLVHKQLKELLEKKGVKPIDALNQPFDPYLHQALMRQQDKAVGNNIVVEVFETGYTIDGEVLRHAKVKVNVHEEE